MRFLLSIDDTDTLETIGTGRLSRMLAQCLCEKLGAKNLGVTRHQLLAHPSIPYTSHNSSACMEVEWEGSIDGVAETARGFMRDHFHFGADPGMAIIRRDLFSPELAGFGRDAQVKILTKEGAYDLARKKGAMLEEFGGTGGGVIGALAGIGLRGSGNDGRFIELEGIRNISGVVSVERILAECRIEQVVDVKTKRTLSMEELIDTKDWIRPDLSDGRIILFVSPNGNQLYSILKEKKNGAGKKEK
ncbi:ABC transporter substrate-binding protein [Candidatus Sumerlaeota bacterium]|nr:ABC transporter substrate-binding protein [Candidatus Sumerlaeota bacterium]